MGLEIGEISDPTKITSSEADFLRFRLLVQGQMFSLLALCFQPTKLWTQLAQFAMDMAHVSPSTLHPTSSTGTQSHSQPQPPRIPVQPASSMSSISVHQPHHPGRRPRNLFIADLSQCLLEFVVQLLPPQEEVAVKEDVRSAIHQFPVDARAPGLTMAHT